MENKVEKFFKVLFKVIFYSEHVLVIFCYVMKERKLHEFWGLSKSFKYKFLILNNKYNVIIIKISYTLCYNKYLDNYKPFS